MPAIRTGEDDLTPAQRAERDRQLAEARRMSEAEAAAFAARVAAWDRRNPGAGKVA